ncbi:MAG: hypothetical protein FJZ90_07005 [Chloroflexi bacterium]|nr:hypothetical protein [Chloroflexota bacterium]
MKAVAYESAQAPMAKSISVAWSEGITEDESEILTQTIEQVLKWLYLRHPLTFIDPPLQVLAFGNWVIPALVPDKPYWGAQWYIEASYDQEINRVIAPTFLELVRHEPWQRQNPHLDLALLEQDLTDFPAPLARLRPDRYSLGTSFPGSMAVMSVHRIRRLAEDHVRRLAMARLVRHNLGHILSVPQFTRRRQIKRLGLESHCTNTCVMRHAATVEDLARLAAEESEMGWSFCPQCTQDLHSVIVRYLHSWS